jgi:hypothetical protein
MSLGQGSVISLRDRKRIFRNGKLSPPSQAWWYMFILLALGRLRQEDGEGKAILAT